MNKLLIFISLNFCQNFKADTNLDTFIKDGGLYLNLFFGVDNKTPIPFKIDFNYEKLLVGNKQ